MIELGRSEIETVNRKKDPFSYVSKLLMFVQRTGDDEKRLRHHLEFVLVRLRRNVIKADISKTVLQKNTLMVADIAYDVGKHIRETFTYSDTKQHNACAELVGLWESPLKFDAKLPQGDHAARKVLAASTNTCKRIVDMCESSIDGELDGTYKEICANYGKDATAARKFTYCKLGTEGMQKDYEKEILGTVSENASSPSKSETKLISKEPDASVQMVVVPPPDDKETKIAAYRTRHAQRCSSEVCNIAICPGTQAQWELKLVECEIVAKRASIGQGVHLCLYSLGLHREPVGLLEHHSIVANPPVVDSSLWNNFSGACKSLMVKPGKKDLCLLVCVCRLN